jgi:prepilin-type N-terminal cleavage/methylation domain-containing protein
MKPTPHRPAFRSPHARGFTIIEVLVVVTVILILLAIGVSVSPVIQNAMGESKTKAMLRSADSLLQAALAETDQTMNQGDGPVFQSVHELVEFASRHDGLRTMLEAFGENLQKTGGTWRIIDGWKIPIHLMATDDHDTATDHDGGGPYEPLPTEAQGVNDNYQPDLPDLPRDRPYFASRGPNGYWGDHDSGNNTRQERAADNYYSFDLEQE